MPLLRSLCLESQLAILRRYFYSGWAFLIPYLAVYLLYYATRWPVNAAGSNIASADVSPSPSLPVSPSSFIPCLLHVYWVLHAIHAILAGFALWGWWSSYCSKNQGPSTKCQNTDASPPSPLEVERWTFGVGRSALAIRLAPWALLALLFYIPGVYLEWPSDPWEHLRRINEWRVLDTVGAHSSWMKSAYFIPYSLLSWCIGLRQLFWLDFYYTGICLLLCWQYYRFSRACGLGERSSMVFVIIQALLFGNNIFSFYRYYGISSSIYAQLGAIAFTRSFLEWAAWGTNIGRNIKQKETEESNRAKNNLASKSPSLTSQPPPSYSTILTSSKSHNPPITPSAQFSPASHLSCNKHFPSSSPSRSSFWDFASLRLLISEALLLIFLTAFNHPQGLPIEGLAFLAIVFWRLTKWRSKTIIFIALATFAATCLALYLAKGDYLLHESANQTLTNWLTFDIFSYTSTSSGRTIQILSAVGLLNVLAACILIIRNSVVGWITLIPLILLITPASSIPIVQVLLRHDPNGLHIFQRLLFAIPFSLAGVELAVLLLKINVPPFNGNWKINGRSVYLYAIVVSLPAIMLLPPHTPTYNRLFNTLAQPPLDSRLIHAWPSPKHSPKQIVEACMPELSAIINNIYNHEHTNVGRTGIVPSSQINFLYSFIVRSDSETRPIMLSLLRPTAGYTFYSTSGVMSTHWLPQEISYVYCGADELQRIAISKGFQGYPDRNNPYLLTFVSRKPQN